MLMNFLKLIFIILCMKIVVLFALVSALCSCSSPDTSRQRYIERQDARAAKKTTDRQQRTRIAKNAYIVRGDARNRLYTIDGTILYSGGSSSEPNELVFLSEQGRAVRVNQADAHRGTYIQFYPEYIQITDYEENRNAQIAR